MATWRGGQRPVTVGTVTRELTPHAQNKGKGVIGPVWVGLMTWQAGGCSRKLAACPGAPGSVC